jgi:hypothetical protein
VVRGCNLWVVIASVIFSWGIARAQKLPLISEVEAQPLIAATERLIEALEYVGAPLSDHDAGNLKESIARSNDQVVIGEIQQILDPYCLVGVQINAESRVKVTEGPAQKVLSEQGWRTFLVKVRNEAGINPILKAESPHAQPVSARDLQTDQKRVPLDQVRQRFLDIAMFNKQPLKPRLSGLALEYRIIQLFSRDTGLREAHLAFNVGQGTQDIGFRNSVPILFECRPSIDVVFGIKDIDGKPTTAAFEIRDPFDRVYPNPARRLAPDFFFHNQVYRADGESVTLPLGTYTVTVSRGPEYLEQTRKITVRKGRRQREEFQLARWAHPARRQYYSGDHHIHAAGCLHYDSPTEGVGPPDIMRHILGEDLNVGCVLTWGLCWSTQKKYFEGTTSKLSQPNHLMRYDVEVSGFPSSHAGHLCLLRLSEDDYPGTKTPAEWPSWTLPVLKWGKEQGGVVGYSHTGWGLGLPDHDGRGNRMGEISYPHQFSKLRTGRAADTLPDYAMPPFDGIGANEYIVTVTHDVCHFISTADTPAIWELNIWYHTLNCGMRARISGETDFPCIYGDKVGLGRVYVKLPRHEKLTFDNWIRGVRDGRSYCGDGRSHVFDFKVNEVAVGESGSDGKISQLNLDQPAKVKVRFETTALLAEKPTPETEAIRTKRLDEKPYWHIERCRIDGTRRVPVEVIVNGLPVARREIEADGSTQSLSFDVDVRYSSWVAVRIFPSLHTNPVFVEVGGKPIRASRRSAQWCRKAVDVCWNAKKGQIREEELADAESAYNKARKVYDGIIAVSIED